MKDVHREHHSSPNFPVEIHQPHLRMPTKVPGLCQETLSKGRRSRGDTQDGVHAPPALRHHPRVRGTWQTGEVLREGWAPERRQGQQVRGSHLGQRQRQGARRRGSRCFWFTAEPAVTPRLLATHQPSNSASSGLNLTQCI